MRILIVEDEPAMRHYLMLLLKKYSYEVFAAEHGQEGLDILLHKKIDLVISDWLMPVMDGIELCKVIRSSQAIQHTYFVMLTGRLGHEHLLKGMQSGVDDYLPKSIKADELKLRIQAAKRMIDRNGDLLGNNRALEKQNSTINKRFRTLESNLEVAGDLQRNLLPKASHIQNIQLQSIYYPASYVAGDIYGVKALDDNHIAFYQIDVSGHSVSSAMLAFTLGKLLSQPLSSGNPMVSINTDSTMESTIVPPADLVAHLNTRFQMTLDDILYFTMIYGVIDSESGEVTFCQAGHPHPLLVSSNMVTKVGNGGAPVGMLPDSEYENCCFRMTNGDHLILYSDGCDDLCVDKPEGFAGIAAEIPTMQMTEFVRRYMNHCVDDGEDGDRDDISLVDIEFVGAVCEPDTDPYQHVA